jgi:hypothetical protein
VGTGEYVPPFLESYYSVSIGVNLLKEHVQFTAWYGDFGTSESCFKLRFRYLAIIVGVNTLEQRKELVLGLFYKSAKFLRPGSASPATLSA